MVELWILALLSRLMNWGCEPVIATRVIAADGAAVRAVVSDPASQWRLIDGVTVLLRPRAQLASTRSPRLVCVGVRLGGRDVLRITWILAPWRGTTEVTLAAQLESRGILARLALLLGGRRWLRQHLEDTLNTLAEQALRAAEDLDDVGRDAELSITSPSQAGLDSFGTIPTQETT